jgi:hypothetical protein
MVTVSDWDQSLYKTLASKLKIPRISELIAQSNGGGIGVEVARGGRAYE